MIRNPNRPPLILLLNHSRPRVVLRKSPHDQPTTSLRLKHSDSTPNHLTKTFERPQVQFTSTSRHSRRELSPTFSQKRHTVLQAITGDAGIMDVYTFPDARLRKKMEDPSKTPLLLIACGSFSPITFLHLRMFIMAADYVKFGTDGTEFELIGGYLSPVSDAYKKQGLASAEHRYDE
jgi:hypothetical protein